MSTLFEWLSKIRGYCSPQLKDYNLLYRGSRKFIDINIKNRNAHPDRNNNEIPWIESLLQTPISDHRKYCVWRILTPYLMNVRNLSYKESFAIIMNWLDKCNRLHRLDFDAKLKIKEGLKGASKGYFPISLEKLKQGSKALYHIVVCKQNWKA